MPENLGSANIEISIELQKLKEGLQQAVNIISSTIDDAKSKLNINPNVETSKAVTGLKDIGTASAEASEQVKEIGSSAAKSMEAFSKMEVAKVTIDGFKEAFHAAKEYLFDFLDEFANSEVITNKLQMGLQRLGDGDYFSKLKNQAAELQKVTPFEDDDIMNMQAMLTTFQMTGEQIEKITPDMLNLAIAFSTGAETGLSLTQTATMIGKATGNDMVAAMQRVGVMMTEAQKKQFELASGMDRINILSKILQQNGNITAQAYGQTLAGGMKIAKNEIKDVKEEIGAALAPVMQEIIGIVKDVVAGFSELPTPLKLTVVAFGALAVVIPPLIPMVMALQTAMGGFIGPLVLIAGMLVGGGALAGGLALLGSTAESSAKGIEDLKVKTDEAKTSLKDMQTIAQGYDADVQSNSSSNIEYADALARVKEQYPGISAGINDVTGKEMLHKNMIDDLIASKKEEIRIKEEAQQIEQNEAWAKTLEDFTTAQEKYNNKLEEYKKLQEELNNEEAKHPASDAGIAEQANNINILTNKLKENAKWLATNTDGTDKFKQGIQQMLITGMKLGNVEEQFKKMQTSVQGNESAVNVLKQAFTGFTNPAISALMGLDAKLKASTKLFHDFTDAQNKIKNGDLIGGLLAMQKVLTEAEDVKITEPNSPKSSTGTGKSSEKKDPKEEEKKAIQEKNSDIEAEIQRQERAIILRDEQKETLDKYISLQIEKLKNDSESVRYAENEKLITDEIQQLRIKEQQSLDDIKKKQEETIKLQKNLASEVDTFQQKRNAKSQAGYLKEISEIENAYRTVEEKIMKSGIDINAKEEMMNKLRNDKMNEMDLLSQTNKFKAEDELHKMIIENTGSEYEISLNNINEKYQKDMQTINDTYNDETMRAKMLKQLDIKRENEISSLRLKNLGALKDAFMAVGQAVQNGFSDVWNSIFGEANSLLEVFLKTLMEQITSKLFSKGIMKLLELLTPGGGGGIFGFLSSLFDTGGYTGAGDDKEIAGFVHRNEYVIKADSLSKPGNMAIAALMNAGTNIQDMLQSAMRAGQEIIPRIDLSMPKINYNPEMRFRDKNGTNVKIDMHGDLTDLFAVKVMDQGIPIKDRKTKITRM